MLALILQAFVTAPLVWPWVCTLSGAIVAFAWSVHEFCNAGSEPDRFVAMIFFAVWLWPFALVYLIFIHVLNLLPDEWFKGTCLEGYHTIVTTHHRCGATNRSSEASFIEWVAWSLSLGASSRYEARFCHEVKVPDRCNFNFEKMDRQHIEEATELMGMQAGSLIACKVLVVVGLLWTVGAPAFFMICAMFLALLAAGAPGKKPIAKFHNREEKPCVEPPGVYDIYRTTCGFSTFVGMGYLDGRGSFCTNIHVTRKCDIQIGGYTYPAHTSFDMADQVAYCKNPAYAPVSEGDSIVAVVTSPHVPTHMKRAAYVASIATVFDKDEGIMIFPSVITDSGVSGSPIFKRVTVSVREGQREVLQFVGCMNASTRRCEVNFKDKVHWQAGVLKTINGFNDDIVIRVTPGSHCQVFGPPGCGKSTFVIPHVIETGFKFVSRIFVAGPTRVIAKQAFKSIKDNFSGTDTKVSLSIRGGRHDDRADIVCVAHATLLQWIILGGKGITKKHGFIIDETHFNDSRTKMLVHYLRQLKLTPTTEKCGFVVEMTATGMHIEDNQIQMCTGSNHHITDVCFKMEPQQDKTLNEQLSDYILKVASASPTKRILVFLPKVRGIMGVNDIYQMLAPRMKSMRLQPVTRLFRTLYDLNIKGILSAADTNEPAVILTTSLSECGANFSVDIVIDSCAQLRFQVSQTIGKGACILAKDSTISDAQRIQRRGRVGRKRPGEYHYRDVVIEPGMYAPYDAENFDRDVFVASMVASRDFDKFQAWENEDKVDPSLILTQGQLQVWLDCTRVQDIRSSRIVKLFYNIEGIRCSDEEISARVRRDFLCAPEEDGFFVGIGDASVKVKFWDARDSDILRRLIRIYSGRDDIGEDPGEEDDLRYAVPPALPARVEVQRAYFSDSTVFTCGTALYKLMPYPRPLDDDCLQNYHHPSEVD